jgi:ApaG protein
MKARPPVYFSNARSLQELEGLTARLDRIEPAPELDAPADRPHPFVYTLTIRNDTPNAVTIKARKWVIKEIAAGRCHVVEGDGVAGRTPRLEPGTAFSFDSFHVIAADSTAEGGFLAYDDAGTALLVRVPAFSMRVSD